ncbi:hypothetical protein IWZ01DRAFT_507486 [Phyllosticta capitalensis]
MSSTKKSVIVAMDDNRVRASNHLSLLTLLLTIHSLHTHYRRQLQQRGPFFPFFFFFPLPTSPPLAFLEGSRPASQAPNSARHEHKNGVTETKVQGVQGHGSPSRMMTMLAFCRPGVFWNLFFILEIFFVFFFSESRRGDHFFYITFLCDNVSRCPPVGCTGTYF